MRNSLLFKLLGAFLMVIIIGSLLIAALTTKATSTAFNLYTTRNGQILADRLVPLLQEYYTLEGSWQGVDVILQSGAFTQTGMMMENRMGRGRGAASGQMPGVGMMEDSDHRLLLVDPQGYVISDSINKITGQQLPAADLGNGLEITSNGKSIARLIVTPVDSLSPASPALEFLGSVNKALLTSALIAGLVALVAGTLLFLQITAPLGQLKKAARAIAQGDLNQRVSIRSRDELGELGDAFNQMAENLSNAEAQRQRLVADVAHELRTPLAAIQGTLEAIQDGILPSDPEQISALYSETTLLNRLVGDLRLLSLAEAGQLKLELVETDIGELVSRIVERSKGQALQKGINLQACIQPGLPNILIDSDRITQVVNNLLGNALRYAPPDGTVTIGVDAIPGQDSLGITVTDPGPGINPQDLPLVFDRFYRADRSRTRASGGSGLGLAIVRQLVEAHGGSVKAESPVFFNSGLPYGTSLVIALPYARPNTANNA